MNKEQYGSGIAMTDLATNLLGVFICLFMLSFLMMSKKIEEKSNKIESKAELVITITWDKDSKNDVDAYVEDPLGNLVFFRAKEKGLMHLDRDDFGLTNDTIMMGDGNTVTVRENREIVSLRGIVPGEYIINVHMYAERDKAEKTQVTVKLEKINPTFKTIALKEVELGITGDEKTAFRFTLDNAGDATNINELSKELAKTKMPISIQYPQYPQYTPLGEQILSPNSEGTTP